MYQQLTIVGYLGNDPVMRFTPSGQAVTSFSVATSRSYTNNAGQKVDETAWFRISVWGAQAECPDPESGGPRVFTRKDGSMGASYEVTAMNVRFLPSGGDGGGFSQDKGAEQGGVEDDDIPF